MFSEKNNEELKNYLALPCIKRKPTKQQISLTINSDILSKLDDFADKSGQSRASLINMAILQLIKNGISLKYSE